MPKTYPELIDELDRRDVFNIRPGLERVQAILAALGNPQDQTPSIHIAGTNGKGSVAAGVESILRHAGYRTGFYSSPHLVDWLERFRINGEPTSQNALLSAARRVLTAEKGLNVQLTHFEFLTVCGFVVMEKAKCDFLILETGMGGRWDATNAVKAPLVSVITSIGIDHVQWLGDTEQAIAAEKAGIIKSGVPVVSGVRGPGQSVIRRAARDNQSPFHQLDQDFFAEPMSTEWEKGVQSFAYRTTGHPPETYLMNLLGSHQIDNGAIILKVVDVLRACGHALPAEAVREGLAAIHWPCRFQIVQTPDEAPLLLDGAHNPHALRRFLETLRASPWAKKSKTVIFSAYKDKDYRQMAKMLLPVASQIVLCQLPGRRGLSLQALRDTFPSDRITIYSAATPEVALHRAWRHTAPEDLVVATGSLALVGQLWHLQKTLHPVSARRKGQHA